jgi:hypothetical protein
MTASWSNSSSSPTLRALRAWIPATRSSWDTARARRRNCGTRSLIPTGDRRSSTSLFGAAVVALGGLRGIAALAGLAATIVVLLAFVWPAVLEGRDPLAVALVGASAIAFLALYTSHGFTVKTTVALLGTLGGLACVAILALAFMALADITGFGSEEAFVVSALGTQIDLRGLVLGGMVIGALGAIDDMTVTQASAVSDFVRPTPTSLSVICSRPDCGSLATMSRARSIRWCWPTPERPCRC